MASTPRTISRRRVGSLLLGAREREPGLFCVAAVFLAPALFFGMTLAVRVDCMGEDDLRVSTLLFWRRQICRRELAYQDEYGIIYAPRVWVSVRGRLPIYFDLLGKFPIGEDSRRPLVCRNQGYPEKLDDGATSRSMPRLAGACTLTPHQTWTLATLVSACPGDEPSSRMSPCNVDIWRFRFVAYC